MSEPFQKTTQKSVKQKAGRQIIMVAFNDEPTAELNINMLTWNCSRLCCFMY